MPTRPRQHGFTIIELMVTLAILGLMLFLVNEIFNSTSVAVTTSVQNSKTIAQSRSINEQLTNDADAMLGPDSDLNNEGGYIVIIQERLPGVEMLNPQTLDLLPSGVPLRSDQLLFIRDAEGLKSMTPSNSGSYATNLIGMPSDRAKVWYGHALRTDAGAALGTAGAGLDRVGNNFILGRQALLFNPTDSTNNLTITDLLNPNSYTSFGDAYAATTFQAQSDVTGQDYGALLTQLTNAAADTTGSTGDSDDYRNTTYHANRLWVNTTPGDDDYTAIAIAQGHPILAQSCSEVIIDFAADLNGNGRIDRVAGGNADTTGAIYWYDSFDDGALTWAAPSVLPTTGAIAAPQILNDANEKVFIFRVDDDVAHPGPLGTVATNSSWPYLIRVRYRLHDTRGRLTGNYADALRDGIDNDGDGVPDEEGEDRISGRWFERIIAVPRP